MSANNEDLKKVTQRRRPHGPGARMMPGEKAKDFKGSIGKLVRFMGQFKAALVLAIIFAIGSAASISTPSPASSRRRWCCTWSARRAASCKAG